MVRDGHPGGKHADGQSDPRASYETSRAYRHDSLCRRLLRARWACVHPVVSAGVRQGCDMLLERIAKNYQRTPKQVALAWLLRCHSH